MNRDTKNLLVLGVVCGICVILLNFFLAHFSVLIWPALGATSVVFALLILDSLFHLVASPGRTFQPEPKSRYDELARLQETIKRNISKHESQSTLVERLRTVGLSVASARMNLSKEHFCELIGTNPELVNERLKDDVLLSVLSGKKSTLTNVQELHDILLRIERL
jgi:hypothetical protein